MSTMLLAQNDTAISEDIAKALDDVQQYFKDELISQLECVNQLATHVEQYRGKMLRPTLVILSAMANNPARKQPDEAHKIVATVIEMVHMATLVHDDILDEAKMRRRGSTINSLFGNEAAVMLGDYLISHAYHLCSSLEQPHINRAIASATNLVCEGELLQLYNRNNRTLDETTYFNIIRRKTASLCGTCCQLPAVIDHCGQQRRQALYEFGEKLGTAFQIVDDLLDLTGDQKTVGKTLGKDLEKGKLTLPIIHYFSLADEKEQNKIRKLLEDQSDPVQNATEKQNGLHVLRQTLASSNSVDYSRGYAQRLIDEAKAALSENLPQTAARTLLMDMADAVLLRQY